MNNEAEIRVGVLVSEDPSDLFFANQLARRTNVVAIIVERQRLEPDRTSRLVKAARLARKPKKLIRRAKAFWGERFRREAFYYSGAMLPDFGDQGRSISDRISCPVQTTSGAFRVNEPQYVEWMTEQRPDVLLVCGTSLLQEPMLAVPASGEALNLHGGLSQWYRGLFTTDWAFFDRLPERVGATVHRIAPGIDDGAVVFQGRPRLYTNDNPNTAYEKVVKLGVEMMLQAVIEIERGTMCTKELGELGRICRRKDFTHAIRCSISDSLATGLMEDYVRQREDRDSRVLSNMINPFNI